MPGDRTVTAAAGPEDERRRLGAAAHRLVHARWPEILLTALVFLFLADCWCGGRVLAMRDFFVEYQPYASRFFGALVRGTASGWDSARQCGIPRLAQPAETPFYPPAIVFAVADADRAALLNWTFHLAVAAMSSFALARHWKLSTPAALLAAITFAFNTYVVCFMEFQCSFVSLVWLPLVVLMVDRISRGMRPAGGPPRPRPAGILTLIADQGPSIALLAVALACQLLGMGEYCYYSLLLSSVLWLGLAVGVRKPGNLLVPTACLVVAGTLGLCLALPQLAMTLELLPLSDRAGEVDAIVAGTSAHPRHWLTFLLPFLYGRPGYPAATWAPDIYEIAVGHCYVGLVPLILAGFAIATLARKEKNPDRTRIIGTLLCLGVFGLVMAAGKFTPVYSFLHAWLPGLKHFRMPTKFYLFVAFALSMLGGIGLDELLKAPGGDRVTVRCWRAATLVAGVLGCIGIAAACSGGFLVAFMAHPGEPTGDQIESFWNDFALAAIVFPAALAALAACMGSPGQRRWAAGVVVAIAFLNLLLVSRQMHPTAAHGLHARRPVRLGEAVGDNAVGRMFSVNWNGQQWLYGKRERAYWDWAQDAGVTAHVLMEGASRVTPNGLGIRRYSQLFTAMLSGPPAIQNRIANLMAVRYVITGPSFADVYWGGATKDVTVIDRPDPLPRARLVDRWSVVDDGEAALARILAADHAPEREAVLEAAGDPPESPREPAGDSAPGSVKEFRDDGDRVGLTVEAQRRCLLVLADTWYPGWTATIDGAPAPIHRTNYLFRGVVIEPGTHRLIFAYRPPWLATALAASGLAACATLAIAVAPLVRSRRQVIV